MPKILKTNLLNIYPNELFSFYDNAFTKKPIHIATINPEFFVEAHKNKRFADILQHHTTNIVDGVGIQWMMRLIHKTSVSRITGVSLAESLCEYAAKNNKSVFFLGGFDVAQKAAEAMQQKHPGLKIAGTCDGNQDTFDEVANTKPDIILVAFGAPKQEYWIHKNMPKIPSLKIAVGVGGTFDFWTGNIPRAPQWMQKIGLEWLFRLIKQPSRYKRIFNAVVVFPWLCVQHKVQSTKHKENGTRNKE